MEQRDKFSELLVVAGLVAYAWYKYSKLTEMEKSEIQHDLKETGKKIVKDLVPPQAHAFLPAALK
ncbi:MAG TPA: hypothetical protein VF610_13360 [Segetibacter sp.]|jgi:hypothetical protein